MPLVRLVAEGVGPFEKLDLDLSDGHGNPHLGPHILAGVNGSGKSTVLRTIAWVLDEGKRGFDLDEWWHALEGHRRSRAVLLFGQSKRPDLVQVATYGKSNGDLIPWIESTLLTELPGKRFYVRDQRRVWQWLARPEFDYRGTIAAYSPSRVLKYLANADLTKSQDPDDLESNCLAFEDTTKNDAIQAWLLSLYSKRAIAQGRKQNSEGYTRSMGRFEDALREIYNEDVQFDVEIEPAFEPRLRIRRKSLNFSQLPDGVRTTVGWIADFMMRERPTKSDARLKGERPGILLLDEVDAHLHPKWQRQLLPAMRAALPNVQIIVTSHSPFVISSCPDSRVHVLDLDKDGHAYARPPVDSPIGESVMTTLMEIFGVDSQFDVQTEKELNEWNDLKKQEASGRLAVKDEHRLQELTRILGERSSELRSIVGAPLRLEAQRKRKRA